MKNPVCQPRPGRWKPIRTVGPLVFGVLAMAGCQESSTAPTDREVSRRLAGAQNPEEELLGGVFRGGAVPSPTDPQYEGMVVQITAIGSGACVFEALTPFTCRTGSSWTQMAVRPDGAVPGGPSGNMWGWFDNLDTETGSPCNPNASLSDPNEWHDLNGDGARDSGRERHCIKPGRYKVEIKRNGATLFSRTVDHFRTVNAGTLLEVEDPAGGQASDTWVHFELDTPVGLNSGTNTLSIDNPATSTLFAAGDTVVTTSTRVRFRANATTSYTIMSPSPLMNRVWFDIAQGTLTRTAHWNPRVIRTRVYGTTGTKRTSTEIATTSDPSDSTGRASPERRVVVQQVPVATVTVSPSSATITTQNGTVTLTATLRDANGNVLTGRTITWSSSNTTVATVSGSGSSATVTGKANGTATITATSEGKSGTSAITVNFTVDNAAANGNTFPSSMTAGGIASVTLSMKNTGSTTWTSTAGYQLKLFRDTAFWFPLTRSLSGSVAPNGTTTFAFDLRHLEPEVGGTIPAFYKMAKSGVFFGAENGRDIVVTAPKGGAALVSLDTTAPQTLSNETVADWVAGAEDAGTSQLPISADALSSNGTVVLDYSYDHEVSRALDIVLKFTFDPKVLEALTVEPGEGAAQLVIESGLVSPGEYWVRLTGTIPAGQGLIAGLPFRLVPGTKLPRNRELGTLTVYYPQK